MSCIFYHKAYRLFTILCTTCSTSTHHLYNWLQMGLSSVGPLGPIIKALLFWWASPTLEPYADIIWSSTAICVRTEFIQMSCHPINNFFLISPVTSALLTVLPCLLFQVWFHSVPIYHYFHPLHYLFDIHNVNTSLIF